MGLKKRGTQTEEVYEVKMRATGGQTAVTLENGDEYEVEDDGTLVVPSNTVETFKSHGFEVVPEERKEVVARSGRGKKAADK